MQIKIIFKNEKNIDDEKISLNNIYAWYHLTFRKYHIKQQQF